jgi:hypothetical protein
MARVFYPYTVWEDYLAGMYRPPLGGEAVQASARLLSDPATLRVAMRGVVTRWTLSTEHALTDPERNRRAWLGQAACCLALGSPEQSTRQAWWLLTDDRRAAANAVADEVIAEWEGVRVGAETLFAS